MKACYLSKYKSNAKRYKFNILKIFHVFNSKKYLRLKNIENQYEKCKLMDKYIPCMGVLRKNVGASYFFNYPTKLLLNNMTKSRPKRAKPLVGT